MNDSLTCERIFEIFRHLENSYVKDGLEDF